MRLHRFYVSQPLGEEVVILEDVSTIKQWLQVLRYKAGNVVVLFNGNGEDHTFEILSITKTSCTLAYTSKKTAHVPARKSYLFVALIKKDLFEMVVEKAVEAGITDIIPLITERTENKNLNLERLHTIIREATEQSGRGALLVLHESKKLQEATTYCSRLGITSEKTYVGSLYGNPVQEIIKNSGTRNDDPVAFFVGPEGGWTGAEEAMFKEHSYTSILFGQTVLRAETAALFCALLSLIV